MSTNKTYVYDCLDWIILFLQSEVLLFPEFSTQLNDVISIIDDEIELLHTENLTREYSINLAFRLLETWYGFLQDNPSYEVSSFDDDDDNDDHIVSLIKKIWA